MDEKFSNFILNDILLLKSLKNNKTNSSISKETKYENSIKKLEGEIFPKIIQELLKAGEEGSLCIKLENDINSNLNIQEYSYGIFQENKLHDFTYIYFQKNYQVVQELIKKFKNLINLNHSNNSKNININDKKLEVILKNLEKQAQQNIQGFKLKDNQKLAIKNFIKNTFHIITGGPGTGKSTIIAFVLETLHQLKLLPPITKIALSAPTGKAAQRLTEAVIQNLNLLSSQISNYEQLKSITLHSLLKFNYNNKKFFYNKERYLPYEIIIVDEASMVDIYLFNFLLDALPDKDFKFLLLGDPHQLPSVEKGAVLKDILKQIESGDSHPSICTTLNESNRHSSNNGKIIYEFSLDILKGKIPKNIDQFWNDHIRNQEDPTKQLINILDFVWEDGLKKQFEFFKLCLNPPDIQELKKRLTSCIGLTFYHSGFFGVESIHKYYRNKLYSDVIKEKIPHYIIRGKLYFPGLPILITKNDASRKLFNGDTGYILLQNGELRGCFIIEGKIHSFAIDTLPPHEEAYFLTVHKSQGSEYNKVYLYIPPQPNSQDPIIKNLFNREILYTAITRAKEELVILGSKKGFHLALENTNERITGFKI